MSLFKHNLKLKLFTFLKIPMVFWMGPKIIEFTDDQFAIKIKCKRFNNNHAGKIFLGALQSGAEICAGIPAMDAIMDTKKPIYYAVKSMQADFIKPAASTTVFSNKHVKALRRLVEECIHDPGVRKELTVNIEATCPERYGQEVIASFSLVVCVKLQSTQP